MKPDDSDWADAPDDDWEDAPSSPQASPQPVQKSDTGWNPVTGFGDSLVNFGKDVGGALKNAAMSTYEGAKDLATGGPMDRLSDAVNNPALTPEGRKKLILQKVLATVGGASAGLAPNIARGFEVLQGKRPEDPFAHQYGNEQVDWNKAYGQSSQAEPGLSLAGGFITNPVGLGGSSVARTAIAAGLNAAPALANGDPRQALVQGTAGGLIQGAGEVAGAYAGARDVAAAARKDAFGQGLRPGIAGKASNAQGQMHTAAQRADEGLEGLRSRVAQQTVEQKLKFEQRRGAANADTETPAFRLRDIDPDHFDDLAQEVDIGSLDGWGARQQFLDKAYSKLPESLQHGDPYPLQNLTDEQIRAVNPELFDDNSTQPGMSPEIRNASVIASASNGLTEQAVLALQKEQAHLLGDAPAKAKYQAAFAALKNAELSRRKLEANLNYQQMLLEHPAAQAEHANIKANEAAAHKADLKKSNAQLADETGYVDPQSAKYNIQNMCDIVSKSIVGKFVKGTVGLISSGAKATYYGAEGVLPEVVQFLTSQGAQSSVGLQNAKLMADPAYRQAMRDEDEKK